MDSTIERFHSSQSKKVSVYYTLGDFTKTGK